MFLIMTIKIRKWMQTDLISLVRYANNPNIAKNLTNGFPQPYTERDGAAFISNVSVDDPVKVFAIDINGEAIGSIGIFPQTDIHCKNAEIGYFLAEEFWGKGIVAEAIKQIVEYGFNTFDINRIFARPFGSNKRSHRVLEKSGFVLEATLKNVLFKDGEYLDELIYAIRK